MRRVVLAASLLVLAGAAHEAQALRLGDERVVIPVIGRFPGSGGTQWRTDVFLCNAYTPGVTFTLRFYPTGAAMLQRTVTVGAYSNAVLTDVVLNTFGLANAGGTLEILSSIPGGSIDARARIYNTGNPAGQFGQNVPGVGYGYLNRQALLYGLSGLNGNRLNIGVANPNDAAVDVTISIRDKDGASLHGRTVNVPAHGYVQYNDIFPLFGIAPREGVTVQFNTLDTRIYGYASEVRNDTGDAVFVVGLSPNA